MGQVDPGDLRSIRKSLGKSQRELAMLLGISTRAVQSYEQGWRPTPPHVLKLAEVLLFLRWRQTNGKPQPCWKIRKCPRSLQSGCPAYKYRAGDFCWLVTNNFWQGQTQDSWEAKLAKCRECPAMQRWLQA